MKAYERLQALLRRGTLVTAGAPARISEEGAADAAQAAEPPVGEPAPRPGVMPGQKGGAEISPAEPLVRESAADRLRKQDQSVRQEAGARKDMAAMRTLGRLLEAVYSRPGSGATEVDRVAALSRLVEQADGVARAMAKQFDADVSNPYLYAQALDSVVSLVAKGWERDENMDWGEMIQAAACRPEIMGAATQLADSGYRRVDSVATARERLTVSFHSAYWSLYMLGESIDGMTPELAASIVQRCADYLEGRDRKIENNDLHVAWTQASIRRLTDLVSAELRAKFEGEPPPTEEQIATAIAMAISGFEGVENHAEKLLERDKVRASEPAPVDGQ